MITGILTMKPFTLLIATTSIALPLIETHSAEATVSAVPPTVIPQTKTRSRTPRAAHPRSRSMVRRVSRPEVLPIQAFPILPTVPLKMSDVYHSPNDSAPLGSDRPICFIERSDGRFMDLSKLCGLQSAVNNSVPPSYPIYPEDRQP